MQGEVIVNRILNDAKLKADEILANANSKVEEINLEIEEYANKKSNEVAIKLEEASKQIQDRYATLARIDGNKIILKSKQNVIKDLKKEALNALLQLNKQELIGFIEKLIKSNASENEVLLLNVANISISDVQELEIVKNLKLNVQENKNKKQIGIILCSEICDKHLLFDQLIADILEQNEAEINNLLFN